MEPEASLSCSQEPSTGPYLGTRSIEPIPPHPVPPRPILILSSHLLLDLPSGLFPCGIPLVPICATFLADLIVLDLIILIIILGEEYEL
jgi:hypothetical protein